MISLEYEVHVGNEVNRLRHEIKKMCIPIFKSLEGVKIYKANGHYTKAFTDKFDRQKLMEQFTPVGYQDLYARLHYLGLDDANWDANWEALASIKFTLVFQEPKHRTGCFYRDRSFTIGTRKNRVFIETNTENGKSEIIDPQEQRDLMKQRDKLRDELSEIEGKIYHQLL